MLLEDKNAVIYGGGGSIGGAHMSAGHLSRRFRLAYGESPYAYLMTRRIERAMALLRRGEAGDQTDQESRSEGTEPQVD
jgi:methylphosphotriester-DNA--protein-cysteine methyltransferase